MPKGGLAAWSSTSSLLTVNGKREPPPTETDIRSALASIDATLGRWKLAPHHLTAERRGRATLDVEVSTDCAHVPVEGIEALVDATLTILHKEAAGLAVGPAGAASTTRFPWRSTTS